MPYAIRTHELTRRFGPVVAVDRLCLAVPRGGVYAFLGPNGAGKTTTIRMLLGLIRPDAGAIYLMGESHAGTRRRLLARVGALVESPSLYPHLTGRENLEATRLLLGAPRDRIDRVLDLVRLRSDAARLVRGYSLGMRQRLGLALALLGEPELLILDEPTNGLDPAGIQEMRALVRSLPERVGATVFLSSHLLGEIEQMATHLGIVRAGRLLFEGTLDALAAREHDVVRVEADPPGDALALLEREGWPATLAPDGALLVPAGRADAARVNALLVAGGIAVHHLAAQRPSLERAFLRLTGEPAGVEKAAQ